MVKTTDHREPLHVPIIAPMTLQIVHEWLT